MKDQSLRLVGGGDARLSGILPGELTLQARYAFERRGAWVGLVDTYGPDSELTWNVGLLQVRHRCRLRAIWAPCGRASPSTCRRAIGVTSSRRRASP